MSRHLRELFDLTGRIAMVTGGSRGLGLQVAGALAEAGATIMLTSRKAEDLQAAVTALTARGFDAASVAGDSSRPEEIQRI